MASQTWQYIRQLQVLAEHLQRSKMTPNKNQVKVEMPGIYLFKYEMMGQIQVVRHR